MTRKDIYAMLLKIPVDLHKRVEKLAVKQHRSRTSVILHAVEEFLEREEKRK